MSKKNVHTIWAEFFENKGLPQNIQACYLAYIDKLSAKKVPIIFEFNHLALLLGRNRNYLASVINSPNNHYRHFFLKKRSGGFRIINSPYPALLEIHYWIYNNILKSIPINSSAHGFAFNKSIVTNAKIHAGQRELLKLDLMDFFPSIKINRIIYVFQQMGYPKEIAFYLASLCSFDNRLPQGAPTSPTLSNIVAKPLDYRLINFAKRFNLKYTRYADDLTFSGDTIAPKFIYYIKDIIEDEGFAINISKTRLYKKKTKRIVTGVSVLDEVIRLPRNYKRHLHQELNFIFKFGLQSHMSKMKIRKANYLQSILGKVNYWLMVEPENKFALEAHNKLQVMYKNSLNR